MQSTKKIVEKSKLPKNGQQSEKHVFETWKLNVPGIKNVGIQTNKRKKKKLVSGLGFQATAVYINLSLTSETIFVNLHSEGHFDVVMAMQQKPVSTCFLEGGHQTLTLNQT